LVQNRKFREIERYTELEPKEEAILAKAKHFLIDAGGWVDVTYTEFYDDDNSRQEKDIFDADISVDSRAWFQAIVRPKLDTDYIYEHTLYGRVRDYYVSRWPNEEQPAAQDDNDGPHMDLLYLDLDFQYAKLRTGRQYLSLGQGIAYSNVHDGIQLTGKWKAIDVNSFFSHTLPHEENIDFSIPGFDKESDRYFVGTELGWSPAKPLRMYSFFLIQNDRSDPNPELGTDFAYQSQYWGFGSTVTNVKGFTSWAEYIVETGNSAVFDTNDRKPILGQAVNVGASYQFSFLTHPTVTAEYAFGSGDKDRASVTNTENGNFIGHDYNFLPFGYIPSGYALAPTLSNIQFLHLGASFRPLEKYWRLKHLSTGIDSYFYWKNKALGGIYDIDATRPTHEIGQEIDATIYWQLASDVIASVRYGMFFPGNAYPLDANDSEIYLSSTLTFIL